MASTYSDLKIELIGTGEQTGTWGTTTNNNFSVAIGEAITGSADVAFSSADVTVTLTDTNAAQTARNLRLNLTGTSGGARQLILGSGCQIEKLYLINNGLADAVTVKNTSGTGIAVPAGKTMFVFNNGTNVVEAVTASVTPFAVASGGTGLATLTANNVLLGNGTSNVQFVAPGSTGNVLTSNGTTWTSAAAAAFDSGTVMLFAQTTAPTGWTKNTSTGDNSALRVTTGTASTGGSVAFTTAFASQTPSGSVSTSVNNTTATNQATTATNQAITPSGSVSITSVAGSAGSTTLSTPQIPSHNHGSLVQNGYYSGDVFGVIAGGEGTAGRPSGPTTNTGGGGDHTHPFSFSSGSGTFSGNSVTALQNSHNHTQDAHNHTASSSFTGNAINLAVQYIDVIRASKN
jgi:hypothetical protein